MKKIFFTLIFSILFASIGYNQEWKKDSTSNAFYLRNLFYQYLKDVVRGPDSEYYAITSHRPDVYWKKKKSKSEMIVSRIDTSGNIHFVRKLDNFAEKPSVSVFNNKYYLLDEEWYFKNDELVFDLYVYASDWTFLKKVTIPEIPHQKGIEGFVLDKNDFIYFITSPYWNYRRSDDFPGSYIVKMDLNGKVIKKTNFKKCYLYNLSIRSDTLFFEVHPKKYNSPRCHTDTILNVSSDLELNLKLDSKIYNKPIGESYKNVISLTGGDKIVYIDSIERINEFTSRSHFKLALIDSTGKRKWTFFPDSQWLFGKSKALKNGSFLVEVDKKWSVSELIIFDKLGKHTTIASLSLKDVKYYYHFIDFFEFRKNEIWVFYNRSSRERDEQIYFERILIAK